MLLIGPPALPLPDRWSLGEPDRSIQQTRPSTRYENRELRCGILSGKVARAGRPSQRNSLAKDSVATIPVQRLFRSDVNFDAKQFLEILNELRVIEQAAARLPGDQQVQVAVPIGFTQDDRAEHAEVLRAEALGGTQNFVPVFWSAMCRA
jgi:hypothetical protein